MRVVGSKGGFSAHGSLLTVVSPVRRRSPCRWREGASGKKMEGGGAAEVSSFNVRSQGKLTLESIDFPIGEAWWL